MTLALQGVSQPALYCDICPKSRMVLQARMQEGKLPSAPVIHDVADLPPDLENIDCITAGFPCTGFAKCGIRGAFQNPASALFFDLVNICEQHRPWLVFMENTPAISEDSSLSVMTNAFGKIGYCIDWCLIPAYAIGLPHTRLRWFAVAYPKNGDPTNRSHLRQQLIRSETIVPVQPPRTSGSVQPNQTTRFGLLKNALIPTCARFAIAYLLSGAQIHRQPSFPRPDLKLKFEQGDVCLEKRLWPTLFGGFRNGARVLNARASRDLLTAIKYEADTEPGHVNFAFLEWLMGFPAGWTLL